MTAARQRSVELGPGRVRGVVEAVVWVAVAALVAGGAATGGSGGAVLALVLLAALSPYLWRALQAARGRGHLRADARQRAFYREGRRVAGFDEVRRLRSRMVNATCEEFSLEAELGDGRCVPLYEGEPTNAAWHACEAMARLVGAPFEHRA